MFYLDISDLNVVDCKKAYTKTVGHFNNRKQSHLILKQQDPFVNIPVKVPKYEYIPNTFVCERQHGYTFKIWPFQ